MITQQYINDLTYKVVGACIQVHQIAGPGLDEEVYHQCLEKELLIRKINFKSERIISFNYKGENINAQFLLILM